MKEKSSNVNRIFNLKEVSPFNLILMWVMCFFAIFPRIYEYEYDWHRAEYTGTFAFVTVLITLALTFFLAIFFLRFIPKVGIYSDHQKVSKKEIVIFFLIALIPLIIAFAGYAPGAVEASDTHAQYQQAVSGQYNDWHPVLHTLITFTFPLAVTGGRQYSIVVFQCAELTFALTYLFSIIRKYSTLRFAVVMELFLAINPVYYMQAMMPYKDVLFGIFAVVLFGYALEIWFSNGKWLKKKTHCILCASFLAAESIIRHNGILLTAPLLLGMILITDKKTAGKLTLCAAIVFAGIRFPLYKVLNVKSAGSRPVEITGVPLTVLGAAMKDSPELLDSDLRTFGYEIADKNEWVKTYDSGDFNSLKFYGTYNNSLINETGIFGMFSCMLKCFKEAPMASFNGFFRLMDTSFSIDGNYYYYTIQAYYFDDVFYYFGSRTIHHLIVDHIKEFTNYTALRYLFLYPGLYYSIIYAFIVAGTDFRNKKSRCRFWMAGSAVSYTIGTSMLLTGHDYRFFWLNYLIFAAVLLMMNGKNDLQKDVE